jgi:FMN-dependent NADH-azoreductase
MTKILTVRSSANGDRSVSNRLIDAFLDELAQSGAALDVVDRNLDSNPVPHVTSDTLAGIGRPAPETDSAKPTRALSDELIAEVQDADLILVGAPMYNFSLPSTLKSWFDHVLRAGATFQYTAAGPEGLLKGKRAIIFGVRAGFYSEGDSTAVDFQIPYLKHLLGFMGVTDVETVLVEKLAFGEEAANASISDGHAHAKRHAASFAPIAA